MTEPLEFGAGSFVFRVGHRFETPAGWRVLFRGSFSAELVTDRRMPVRYGGFGEGALPDEVPSRGSWLLARLTFLLRGKDRPARPRLRSKGGKIELDLSVTDERGPVAIVTVHIERDDARLVGRMRSGDLEDSIALALLDALLAQPDELGEVTVRAGPGAVLGFSGGVLLGSIPRPPDWSDILNKILDGQLVERLPDDKEESCPLPRAEILADWLATRRRPPKKDPSIAYLQSFRVGDGRAWAFEINVGRSREFAVVHETGRPRDHYTSMTLRELPGTELCWYG